MTTMKSFDFKTRFIGALPSIPPGLELNLDRFVEFDKNLLSCLAEEDSAFLERHGLPCDASPFLSFSAYSPSQIAQSIETFALPPHYLPIGNNGAGDIIAIDEDSRQVVYFNHDAHNLRVFINSTVNQFAECLCVFQEHLRSETMSSCLTEIEGIDAAAANVNTMWHSEVMAEISKL
ncbi:SMI1/KNR4 family protein [Herbaspirillum sp. 1130]|uniref:SMI1/KNR4 family protein n=1 Tax=Herbaspirillum sp. 1130 TaxID=2806562 RepID=UPI001AE74529|nr:SMI1/KNR4 family protein [Herbaspirillum sp. 1130]